MSKVVKGTKDKKKYQVLKGPSDTRQLRCTKQTCKNLVVQVPDGKGGFVYECPVCKARYSFLTI